MKTCSRCGEKKPGSTEYFGKKSSSKDGLRSECRECRTRIEKEKYIANPEAQKQRSQKWIANNPGARAEASRRYRLANPVDPEERSKKFKQWREDNRDAELQRCREWRSENPEYFRNYTKENADNIRQRGRMWRENNRDKYNTIAQRRRSKLRSLPHTLTASQWAQIVEAFGGKCAYCGSGGKLHQEHYIPLALKGEYTHNNIIPACAKCNHNKNASHPAEWYHKQPFYSRQREETIHCWLGYKNGQQQLSLCI